MFKISISIYKNKYLPVVVKTKTVVRGAVVVDLSGVVVGIEVVVNSQGSSSLLIVPFTPQMAVIQPPRPSVVL